MKMLENFVKAIIYCEYNVESRSIGRKCKFEVLPRKVIQKVDVCQNI